MNQHTNDRTRAHVVPAPTLRKSIGFLGFSFPIILCLGAYLANGSGIQDSLSAYYHTPMRDAFVGILCGLGFALLSYRGYERIDSIVANFACLFAVATALFPTQSPYKIVCPPNTSTIALLHWLFAAAFFVTLIIFALVLFTKSSHSKPFPKRKRTRNRVYQVCGVLMILSIVVIFVISQLPCERQLEFDKWNAVFIFETAAVWAFSFSWLVKGGLFWADLAEEAPV